MSKATVLVEPAAPELQRVRVCSKEASFQTTLASMRAMV
jgi:hypothetical protein